MSLQKQKIIDSRGKQKSLNLKKIQQTIFKAAQSVGGRDSNLSAELAEMVAQQLTEKFTGQLPTTADVTTMIERTLVKTGHFRTAKAFIIRNSETGNVNSILGRSNSNDRETTDIFLQVSKPQTNPERLGMSLEDLRELITSPNRENANIPHGPEATNLTIAETLKKQFALKEVFSPEVAEAHRSGTIHLHDLGFIDRSYCSGQSLEYVKKFGLSMPTSASFARPAKRAEVLLSHMVKFAAALQGHFAGAIGWDAVNIFFAPYLVDMTREEINQLCQMMIFEFAQQAVSRGGQAIFTDLNIYWEIPRHFENVPAIGPGGQYTGKNYGDYQREAKIMAWEMVNVFNEGDSRGVPFFFPKPMFHITDKFFTEPDHQEFLDHVCKCAAEMGSPYFVFDRGDTAKISQCCRLAFNLDENDLKDANQPWKMRYSALQNVSLNLPRAAYRADGDEQKLLDEITQIIEIAVQAHLEKRNFIEEILALKNQGPLGLLAMELDGEPYLRLHRATSLVGIIGLNELVQYHTSEQLHDSIAAFKFGLKIISFVRLKLKEYSEKYKIKLVMEQTPAESTALRLAKLDLINYPDQTTSIIKGDIADGEVYYTNSTYINVGLKMDPVERVKTEGLFHPLIEAGALTHVWLGEARPDAECLASFVTKTFHNTSNAQIAFSPEFTICYSCQRSFRGLKDSCPSCGSNKIDGVTRITGYFTKISTWNKGKIGELKDRYRTQEFFGTGYHFVPQFQERELPEGYLRKPIVTFEPMEIRKAV